MLMAHLNLVGYFFLWCCFFIIEVASTIFVSLIGAIQAIKPCLYSLKCLLVSFTTNKGTVLFWLKHKTVLITFNPGSLL